MKEGERYYLRALHQPDQGTAGIEPASGAEGVTAAKPEALEPGAHGEAGNRQETSPQGGKRKLEVLPRGVQEEGPGAHMRHCHQRAIACSRNRRKRAGAKLRPFHQRAKHECGTTPQGNPSEGERDLGWQRQEALKVGALAI